MPLFHPRVISKHTQHQAEASLEHQEILSNWEACLAKGGYDSETQNDGQFIQYILVDLLGYKQSGNSSLEWNLIKNLSIGSGNADAAVGFFKNDSKRVIAPFELKGAKTRDLDAIMPGRGKTPVQQAWEYAMDAKGAKWVLLSNYREIRLYAVGYGRKDYEFFDLSKASDIDNYKKLILLLSADNLLNGNTEKLLIESGQVEKEITNTLYKDYKRLRSALISEILDKNLNIPSIETIQYAQTILDRILFIAFSENRGLLPEGSLKKAYETRNPYLPQPVWKNFLGLFEAIDKGNTALKIPRYNGGLFKENSSINKLKISDELCEEFKLISEYNFASEVSVNILGYIFEQSITDIEEFKSSFDVHETTRKRKKDGVFYTPPHITNYIVEQAVGGWLEDRKNEIGFHELPNLHEKDYSSIALIKSGKNKGNVTYNNNIDQHIKAWESYQKVLSNIKVLDPACGSGAFLNEVFDYLYREGLAINSQLTTLRGGQHHLFRWDKHILTNNLYGVDVNSESIEITKLSLWLKTANKGEKLTYLDNNIKCGNSLISDPKVSDNYFVWWEEFKEIGQYGGFDVIVGNPPYVFSRDSKVDEFKEYAKNNYNLYSDKINLYLLFVEKSLQLTRRNGYMSLIIPNSFLGVDSAACSRKHLVEETEIKSVINLLGNTFKDASVEAMVFCTKKNKPDNNEIKVGNVSSSADLESRLIKVPQVEWLKTEKTIFDLRSNTAERKLLEKLDSFPKLNSEFDAKTGLQAYEKGKGEPKQTAEDVKDRPFDYDFKFDASTHPYLGGSDVSRYSVNWAGQWLRWGPWLSQPRDMSLFQGPRVLIREITAPLPYMLMAAYIENTYINNKSIINVLPKSDNVNSAYLAGVLNSKLLGFYHSRRSVKSNRAIFPKVVISDVNNFPFVVPSNEVQSEVADNVFLISHKLGLIRSIEEEFLNLLKTDLKINKVGKALQRGCTIDFDSFIEALRRSKINLSLESKSQWYNYHSKKNKEWLDADSECNTR